MSGGSLAFCLIWFCFCFFCMCVFPCFCFCLFDFVFTISLGFCLSFFRSLIYISFIFYVSISTLLFYCSVLFPLSLFFLSYTIFIYLFIYLWLCWVFVSVQGLSPVAARRGHSSSRCTGLSLLRPLLLQRTGSRHAGSVIVARGPSCSTACGILPDQGSNPCPLHWQADSQPLRHQGSPLFF